jgi:hypothetical protein
VDIVLADLGLEARVRDFVIYILAVVGGFVLGNLLTLILCRLLGKRVFKQRIPEPIERALRVIGGILLALLVAFLLYRGWGFGGTGAGEGKEAGGPGPGKENPGNEKQPRSKTTTNQETVTVTRLVVTIQPAMDYPRTFRFEGAVEGLEMDAATKKLDELKAAGGDQLQLLELRVYKNSSEIGTRDVNAFIEYANKIGIHTRVDKIDRKLD